MDETTCCPGNKNCERSQPPRLFQVEEGGCWAVALAYTELEDNRIKASEWHFLDERDCEALSANALGAPAESGSTGAPSPQP